MVDCDDESMAVKDNAVTGVGILRMLGFLENELLLGMFGGAIEPRISRIFLPACPGSPFTGLMRTSFLVVISWKRSLPSLRLSWLCDFREKARPLKALALEAPLLLDGNLETAALWGAISGSEESSAPLAECSAGLGVVTPALVQFV
jgi:hypothetical protein